MNETCNIRGCSEGKDNVANAVITKYKDKPFFSICNTPGENACILGVSGCGKNFIMKICICRDIMSKGNRVYVMDQTGDFGGQSTQFIERIGGSVVCPKKDEDNRMQMPDSGEADIISYDCSRPCSSSQGMMQAMKEAIKESLCKIREHMQEDYQKGIHSHIYFILDAHAFLQWDKEISELAREIWVKAREEGHTMAINTTDIDGMVSTETGEFFLRDAENVLLMILTSDGQGKISKFFHKEHTKEWENCLTYNPPEQGKGILLKKDGSFVLAESMIQQDFWEIENKYL